MPELNSAEIGNVIADREKFLQELIRNKGEVISKIHELSRKILLMEIDKRDYTLSLSKARDSIRILELDIKQLQSQFWSCRQSGT